MHRETLTYQAEGLTMQGELMFELSTGRRAGILIFPEAFGLNEHALEEAQRFAELGYVVLACDLHGNGRVIDDLGEAMTELQPLFDDPHRTRARAVAGLSALAARPEVDPSRIAAVGYCFPMPLELARSGADVKATIGFHTGLDTAAPVTDRGVIKGRVLVCVGSDDPFITQDKRAGFESEMRDAGVDWQMDVFGNTVHSFTVRTAARRNMPEAIRYNPEAKARAWASALNLLDAVLK